MATITAFSTAEKTSHNSHKFAFTLSPTNYGYWKAMLEPFLSTNNLLGYVDGTIPFPAQKVGTGDAIMDNLGYPRWIANDAHVWMIIISTISERAYSPNTATREYTLKTQLLKIAMKGNESP